MLKIQAQPSFKERNVLFAVLEVNYPDRAEWNTEAFETLKEGELAGIRETFADYDRKAVFGENSYYRYFKKFKKSYPVMMQLESFLLKGRPFPKGNPINEVAFLAELKTQVLLGTHDLDRVEGPIELFSSTEKIDFPGMRGEPIHIYPGDVSGRDDRDIILSMIGGADDRTCLHQDSRHIGYIFFGTPQSTEEDFAAMAQLLTGYINVLAPSAEIRLVTPCC